MLRRFPVTLLLLAQFVPFAVIPAFVASDGYEPWFVLRLVLIGAGSAFAVEWLAVWLHKPGLRFHPAPEWMATGARRIAIAALAVAAIATLAGVGTYAQGIGASQASAIGVWVAPLRPWTFVAVGFLLFTWRTGQMAKRETMLWIASLAGAELLVGFATARMAPVAGMLFSITAVCVLFGLIRFRTLAVVTLIGVLAWPTLAEFRNESRREQGAGQAYARDFDAADRLRMDKLMGRAVHFDVPVDVGQPGLVDVVRYGLIPRALDPDPDRAEVATGRRLNVFLGGSSTSSNTFMLLGNVWMLAGPWGLVAYCVGVATLMQVLLLRRIGPVTSALLAVTIYSMLWMGLTYPDGLIGWVQCVVATLVAYWLIAHTRLGQAPAEATTTGDARGSQPSTPTSSQVSPSCRQPGPTMTSSATFTNVNPSGGSNSLSS